jgi:hypothetical protein
MRCADTRDPTAKDSLMYYLLNEKQNLRAIGLLSLMATAISVGAQERRVQNTPT